MGQFIIVSEITKKPYIDEKRNAFLFFHDDDSKKYTEKIKNTTSVDISKYDFLEICSYAYSSGAINLIVQGEKAQEVFRLEKDKLKKKYYNSNLNANISRYLTTNNKRYIRALSDCYFIVPIKIENHPNANITYATARIKNSPYVFVAFTDLEEYKKWEKIVKGWKPLEVDAEGFKRIGGKHGYIINPCGRNMIINKNLVSMIPTEDDEEGDYR